MPVPCIFKRGDRVRSLVTKSGLWLGQEYVIEDTCYEGDDWLVYVVGNENGFYERRFEKATFDPLGDAIRRAALGEDGKPQRPPYEPESFVGRDDIDWSRLIKEGGQS